MMPYRKIYLGDGETAIARVSDKAIEEWLEVRERNRGIGYPDRPPDVDTPLFRTWLEHPGEDVTKLITAPRNRESLDNFPVFTLATSVLGVAEAKLLVTYYNKGPDKGYVIRLVVRTQDAGEGIFDKEVQLKEWDEETFEKTLSLFHDLFMVLPDQELMIGTYFDFVEIDAELDLAEQEIKDYYGLPRETNSNDATRLD